MFGTQLEMKQDKIFLMIFGTEWKIQNLIFKIVFQYLIKHTKKCSNSIFDEIPHANTYSDIPPDEKCKQASANKIT